MQKFYILVLYTDFLFHFYTVNSYISLLSHYNIQKYKKTTKMTVAAAANLVYAELMFRKWASFLYFSDKRDKLLAFESRSEIKKFWS